MAPTPPNQKFSLATAILAELEMSEERKRHEDSDEIGREPGPRSGLLFRGEPVEGELEPELVALDGDAAVLEPPRSAPRASRASKAAGASDEPAAAPVARTRSSRTHEATDRAMLLGRTPIGTPAVPAVEADVIDLDALMNAARASRAPAAAPPPAEEVWSFWPPSDVTEKRPIEAPEVVREAPADSRGAGAGLGRGIVIGALGVLAITGAFYAGKILSSPDRAASEVARVETPREATLARGGADAVAQPVEIATGAPAAASREERERLTGRERAADRDERTASSASSRERQPSAAAGAIAESAAEEAPVAATDEASEALDALPVGAAEPEAAEVAAEEAVAAASTAPAEAEPASLAATEAAPAEEAVAAPAPAAPAPTTPATAAAPSGPVPDLPSRADIRRALAGVTPALRACTEHRGTAMMSITIAGSGEVLSATPSGAWAAIADRGCLREAVGRAHLPRFQQSQLTVQFPFVL